MAKYVVTLTLEYNTVKDPTKPAVFGISSPEPYWGISINGLRPQHLDTVQSVAKYLNFLQVPHERNVDLLVTSRQEEALMTSVSNPPFKCATEYLDALGCTGYDIVGTQSIMGVGLYPTFIWTLQMGNAQDVSNEKSSD